MERLKVVVAGILWMIKLGGCDVRRRRRGSRRRRRRRRRKRRKRVFSEVKMYFWRDCKSA